MTIETLKNLLAHYGLNPNKTYGQHFLMDETVLEDMIDAAGVTDGEQVIEIGPGIGNLTERLLERGAKVFAIEKDEQFLPVLKKLQKRHLKLEYQMADALKFNFKEKNLDEYKVVANIPYYITGKIVQLFLQQEVRPISMTLLMQKEVAQNLTAKPGQLNLLAISAQIFGEARLIMNVPAHKFYPAPKVDSAVVHLQLFAKPKYDIQDHKKFFRVLRACFAGKRKQIHNTLTNNLSLSKVVVQNVLSSSGIDAAARPQQLTIEQWIKLVQAIN